MFDYPKYLMIDSWNLSKIYWNWYFFTIKVSLFCFFIKWLLLFVDLNLFLNEKQHRKRSNGDVHQINSKNGTKSFLIREISNIRGKSFSQICPKLNESNDGSLVFLRKEIDFQSYPKCTDPT